MTRIIETADATRSHRVAAGESLLSWHETQLSIHRRLRQSIIEHLSRHDITAEDRRDYQQGLADLGDEERQLEVRWENSSLRRRLEGDAKSTDARDIEQRMAIRSGIAASPVHRASGTSTSTLTAKTLSGHAAVFNKLSLDLGGFREKIQPGAFTNALKTSDVAFLWNHNVDYIYGRNTANTLELSEDRVGLKFICYLLSFDGPSYSLARRIDRQDVAGCSFAFACCRDSWSLARKPGDVDVRTIVEIDQVFDVSAVVRPAYPQTDVQATFQKMDRVAPFRPDDMMVSLDETDPDDVEFFASERTRKRDQLLFNRLARLNKRLR